MKGRVSTGSALVVYRTYLNVDRTQDEASVALEAAEEAPDEVNRDFNRFVEK